MLADASDGLGGIIFVFIFIAGLVLSIAWLVFPFIVISKCNEMIRLLGRIESDPNFAALQSLSTDSARIRGLLEVMSQDTLKLHEAANEKNKATQWMIDNWPEKR